MREIPEDVVAADTVDGGRVEVPGETETEDTTDMPCPKNE